MNKKTLVPIILIVVSLAMSSVAQAQSGWQEVTDASAPFIDDNLIPRTPSCAGALEPGLINGNVVLVETPPDFSFFYRDGDPDLLVIFLDGGGACWDPLTCLGSVINGDPVYNTFVDETTAELDAAGGLGDNSNPENPIADGFQVFIPYCTGDLHSGSNDQLYELLTPNGLILHTIHHRGYDNFLAVLNWLRNHYENVVGALPKKAVIIGASAGGHGAFFVFPAIDEWLPGWTRKRVFSDSAIAIVNQDFYDRALALDGVWDIWKNMPPELANAFAAGPDGLAVAINQSLAWNFPRVRFGQYTRAWDGVQIFYLNIAKNLNDPTLWNDPLQLILTAFEWTFRARISMLFSALTTFNYRIYVGTGFDHTAVADVSVYLENSGGGIRLIDWLDDMFHRLFPFGGDWVNTSCPSNCLP